MRLIDVHTHKRDGGVEASRARGNEVVAIVSMDLALTEIQALTERKGVKYSVALHPWQANEGTCKEVYFDRIRDWARRKTIVAIGETGLDLVSGKRDGNLNYQELSFERHIALSEESRLPLIVHCVHALSQVIQFRKQTHATQPWILHGFNGNASEVAQATAHGMYLSVGSDVLNSQRRVAKSIQTVSLERLFFETDTAEVEIEEVYRQGASLIGVPMARLAEQVEHNYNTVFS